jgi:hypothetical protein
MLRVHVVVGALVGLILPAWDSEKPVGVHISSIPDGIRKKLKPGFRFYADVNIGMPTDHPENLMFKNFREE